MESQKVIDILKQSILAEKRGCAFYASVAEQAKDPEIRNIFTIMAEEETMHVKFLCEQFVSFSNNRQFLKMTLPHRTKDNIANLVLSAEVTKKISAAGIEAAAISAAIDMEKNAIGVYSSQAETSTDPEEQKLFSWLADWERTHLKLLTSLDDELKERIWFDNQFWPF